jgi:hypothetical protein
MQCENLSDDQLWRAIAQNTQNYPRSFINKSNWTLQIPAQSILARGDLIRFAGRIQREYRQYADELRRRHPVE